FVMRPSKSADETAANTALKTWTPVAPAHSLTAANAGDPLLAASAEQATSEEREAYREGFAEGVRAARAEDLGSDRRSASGSRAVPATRVVYRNRTQTRAARSNNSRQVYYDYQQPRKRSFWSKHRDKLTVAAGAGGGAIIGGLVGGKKGAAIGAIAGGGGSALYTYKLRKRNRNY
ncbi:MAG: hypothetical protein ACRD68_04825, partial [Pyrinomonadaceae bacterium]